MYKGLVLYEGRVNEIKMVATTQAKIIRMLNGRLQVKFGTNLDFEIWIGEEDLNTWKKDIHGSRFMVVVTEES